MHRMEALGHNHFVESRAQAAKSATWLRRCNSAMLGVALAVSASSVLMVVGAIIVNIVGDGRRGEWLENVTLIGFSVVLVLSFAKSCLASYQRGVDDLAEREMRLREVEMLLMVSRISVEKGNRRLLDKDLLNAAIGNAPSQQRTTSPARSRCRPNSKQGPVESRELREKVVRIEDVALDDTVDAPLRLTLSRWKARDRASQED